MGLTKTELFSARDNELANFARVLAHPARIAILTYLQKSNACVGMEIVKEIGLAQPTISQHLKELKSIGLIKGEILGTSISYCIDRNKWLEFSNQLMNFLSMEVCDQDQCC